MKTTRMSLALMAGLGLASAAFAQSTAFTYQGRLDQAGVAANGSYDLNFVLYLTNSGGALAVGSQTNLSVAVSNGLFTTTLDFGAAIFSNTSDPELQLSVRTNGGGAFTPLSPRLALFSTPRAIHAQTAAAVTGNGVVQAGQLNVGFGNVLTGGNGTIAGGSGNAATNSFTTVSGGNGNLAGGIYSSVAGGANNQATGDGARIGGGANNVAAGTASSISGGQGNSTTGVESGIAGGHQNVASGSYAAVAGGRFNTASGVGAFVGGGSGHELGFGNSASGVGSVIGGGFVNAATGDFSTIGGGSGNQTTNNFAVVPGGSVNIAGGEYSLAAGRSAAALHEGAYVWADATGPSFASSAANQYLIRASGGVGIGITNPSAALDVEGTVRASGQIICGGQLVGDGGGLTNLSAVSASFAGTANFATMAAGANNATHASQADFALAAGSANTANAANIANTANTANVANSVAAGGIVGLINPGQLASSVVIDGESGVNLAGVFSGNGLGLSALSASALSSGTVGDARLSTNVALRSGGNTFSGPQFVTDGSLNVNSPGFVTAAAIMRARTNDQFPLAVQDFSGNNILLVVTNGQVNLGNDAGSPQMVVLPKQVNITGDAYALAFIPTSDRNVKENFAPVSAASVLDKVVALPISRWNFKANTGTTHIGPMAQDFYAAFGVGPDEKHIATVDADGVALAAIQGLNQKVEQREAEIGELKQRLEKLETLLNQKLRGGEK